MDVDGAGLDIDVTAPDGIQQLFAAEDTTRVLHQVVEQAEFGGAEVDFLTRAADAVGDAVDDNVAVVEAVVGQAGPDAAQDGADAGDQLGHREGLGHIVVGTGVEAADTVAFLAARRQHDDRHVAGLGLAANAPADLDSREFGQHPVQQHQIRQTFLDLEHALLAIGGDHDAVAFLLEVVGQQGRQGVLVFHNQNIGLHGHILRVQTGDSGSDAASAVSGLQRGRSPMNSWPVIS